MRNSEITIITTTTTIIIIANRPDIVLHDKEETCLIIDIAIQFDSNVYRKENENLSKYNEG